MFKYDEDEKKYAAEHHPFTHVLDEDVDKIESDPLACGSYSYDLVMDGLEVGGGTIRIHNADEQRAVLRTCGLTDEEIEDAARKANIHDSLPACLRDTTRWWESAAVAFPEARSSAWPLRACSSRTPRS